MAIRLRVSDGLAEGGGENEWSRHRYTQALAGQAQKQAGEQMVLLLAECRKSADPKVLAAYHDYLHFVELARLLEGKRDE